MKYKTGEDNCVLLTFAIGGIGDVLGDRVQDKRRQLCITYFCPWWYW
jgi:hypothetical protein